MQVALDAPKRAALRYYGGKWKLARWVLSYFPPHTNYLEPCGGAASVLLQKPRSPLETYNDIDHDVVNFFRILRDREDELIRRIEMTPWARAEYETCLDVRVGDEVERARRFFVRAAMSYNGASANNGNNRAYGWRHTSHHNRRPTPATDLVRHDLFAIARRLQGVQIECRDYADVIGRYDSPETLIYVDPPYFSGQRNPSFVYKYEWDEGQHEEAAHLLNEVEGYVVLSGYRCPLYDRLYEDNGWRRVDRQAQTNGSSLRRESLWLSPRTWRVLNHKMSGLPLFD